MGGGLSGKEPGADQLHGKHAVSRISRTLRANEWQGAEAAEHSGEVARTSQKIQVMPDAEIAEKRILRFGCRVRLNITARSSAISSRSRTRGKSRERSRRTSSDSRNTNPQLLGLAVEVEGNSGQD